MELTSCPDCAGPLKFGSRDPCEGDYYWCSKCGAGPILFSLYQEVPTGMPNEKPCTRCLKGTMFLATEDDGSLWYVCNNKHCLHEIEVTQPKKSVSLADCAKCPDLIACDAHITGGVRKQCAPIIDAEESNRALQLVAQLGQRSE